jgi:DUF4097 and DUF4098 domain-containing protein YvlB
MGSRSGIVAVLVAAELLIIGLIIASFGGFRSAFAGGMHRVDYDAAPIAPLDAGSAPHVSINDARDRVVVTTSSDGLVHITDQTQVHGVVWSDEPVLSKQPLKITRTSDGVRIERPSDTLVNWTVFGDTEHRITVETPAASTLAIEDSAGSNVTGITGGTNVKSSDGHITLADLRGAVDVNDEDGYIEANDLQGSHIALHSDDGHLKVRATQAGSFEATTSDGHIDIAGLRVSGDSSRAIIHTDDGPVTVSADFTAGGNYQVSSGDGSVRVTLPSTADLNVTANATDGRVVRDGTAARRNDDGASNQTFTLGGGTGRLAVSSDDGTIEFTTNGAV